LCFCTHCLEAARQAGVDAEMIHRTVRDELERRFAGNGDLEPTGELTRDRLEPFGGGRKRSLLSRMKSQRPRARARASHSWISRGGRRVT
jgi:hypothetical protein